jgi:hypothetical protein
VAYVKPSVLPAWGESNTTSADMIQPTNGQIAAGWPVSSTPPSRQRFNWLINWASNAVRYFMQRGLVDYDASETYQIGARIIGDDGNTYVSIQNTNIGHLPSTSSTWWTPWGFTIAQICASQLTQTTQAPGDSSTKVATDAFVQAAIADVLTDISALSVDVVQTAGLAGSRALEAVSNPDTTPPASDIYHNTTGAAIMVTVSADGGGGGFHGVAYCDASATPTTAVAQFSRVNAGSSSPNFYPGSISFMVPKNYYYGISVTSGGGSPSIRTWTEYKFKLA